MRGGNYPFGVGVNAARRSGYKVPAAKPVGPASGSDSLPPAPAWPQLYGSEQYGNRGKGKSRRKMWAERKNARHGPGVLSSRRFGDQLKRLETDFSSAVRLIASPISGAIEIARMLAAAVMAAVGSMELVITSSFNLEEVTRATAPPDRTP